MQPMNPVYTRKKLCAMTTAVWQKRELRDNEDSEAEPEGSNVGDEVRILGDDELTEVQVSRIMNASYWALYLISVSSIQVSQQRGASGTAGNPINLTESNVHKILLYRTG